MAKSGAPQDVPTVLQRLRRPKRAVVTSGMPYANGPLHLGHIAGAFLPADIYARWLALLIGRDNVLYVCGTDDHGSTTELAAAREGIPVPEFLAGIHAKQRETIKRYSIGLDVYSGTSRPECFPLHKELSDEFFRKGIANGLLKKRTSKQWYDPEMQRFLPDRMVRGKCPNPKCDNQEAYSDECEECGNQHSPEELIEPRSAISNAVPEMRETVHLWLDMYAVSETLAEWLDTKKKSWRKLVLSQVRQTLDPALRFEREHEASYKPLKAQLPKHKLQYAAGGQIVLRFANKADLSAAREALAANGIETELADEWGHRAITRDIHWGLPVPDDDPELAGKTLYVWPDSLIAPIAFSKVALKERGEDPARCAEFWRDPESVIYQFLGQDNVFFYTLMQGAMWLAMQEDPHRLPVAGELNMTEIFACFHLLVGGKKMSKSTGNFYTGDELLLDKGYDKDQIRYYLALLGLHEKRSDFEFAKLDERNAFLAGPLNAALEKPISAAHSKFDGKVPEGKLIDDIEKDTVRMVQRYIGAMQKANYPNMLFELENYARKINSLFTRYKPHDDRHPEEGRRDALFTSFYVLKNLMIMLTPFVPDTMDRVRQSLNLPESVLSIDELGTGMPAGHALAEQQSFFPSGEKS
jgi:methionyl-tRNA synthetase